MPEATISWREIVLDPLFRYKKSLSIIIGALTLLSLSQGMLILMVKGFTTALFGDAETIPLTQIISPELLSLLPVQLDATVARHTLAVTVPIVILVAGLTRAISMYLYNREQQSVTLRVANDIRKKMFRGLLNRKFGFIRSRSAAEWMSLIMNDVYFIQMRFSDVLTGLIKGSVMVGSALVFLAFIHWQSAVLLCLISPLVAFGMGRAGRKISRYAELFQKELANLTSAILDLRRRFDFIQVSKGANLESEKFKASNTRYYKLVRNSILIRSAFAPSIEVLGFFLFGAFLISLDRGYISLDRSSLLQFLIALGIILRPLRDIGEQVARWHETKGALTRGALATLIDTVETSEKESGVGAFVPGIDIRHVLVNSSSEERIAEGKNLALRPGKCIAVIGPSGGGKSTLLRVLAGLVDPKVFDANVSIKAVANHTAFVSQYPFLFAESIAKNLTYGNQNQVSREEIWSVLESVGLADLIRGLPQELDTIADAISGNFSGGQIQRLVVGRSMLQRKPLFLADEVTSAVDPRTETMLTEALLNQAKAREQCLIMVTHRMGMLDRFDEIWFLEQGLASVYSGIDNISPRVKQFIESESSA